MIGHVLEIPDVGNFDFRGRHVALPCVRARPSPLRCLLSFANGCRQTLVGRAFPDRSELPQRLRHHRGRHLAVVRQRLQRRQRDIAPVHLEEGAQLAADNRNGRNRRCPARGSGARRKAGSGRRTTSCSRWPRPPGPRARPGSARHGICARGWSGCSRFQRSASSPSRRNSVKLGQLQISAETPNSASNSAAAITSRRIVPLPSNCTRGRSPRRRHAAGTSPSGCRPVRPPASPDARSSRSSG